jgi:hypothetical protein
MIKTPRALVVIVALAAFTYGLFSPVYAQSATSETTEQHTLNQSVNEAQGDWTRMRPSSFTGTIHSAIEQCLRTANEDPADRLEVSHCMQLETALTNGMCHEQLVADGIVHDRMNGRVDGKSKITKRVRKVLGREDIAIV